MSSETPPPGSCGEWPRVFVLGAQKSATTSLASALQRVHFTSSGGIMGKGGNGGPCCHAARWHNRCDQESHYFERCHDDVCAAGFADVFEAGGAGAYDADPGQLFYAGMPARLRTVMPAPLHPRVRLIAVLREGASRSLSWYNHRLAGTNVASTFCGGAHGHVQAGRYVPSFANDSACELRKPVGSSVTLRQGRYPDALARWRAVWPRKQLLVINFEQLAAQGEQHMQFVIGPFVGVGQAMVSMPHANEQASALKVHAMCCETFCKLATRFGPANEQLYRMLDHDAAARLGPDVEPPFGRFAVPECPSYI